MENSFFIFTDKTTPIEIERFHNCTWEFNNDSSLVEFGFEITKTSIKENQLSISLFIPWLTVGCEVKDLFEKLSSAENSRFIFNDSIERTAYLAKDTNSFGVIHKFSDRNELCILPVKFDRNNDKVITVLIDLQTYLTINSDDQPNIYFRFWIKPKTSYISMRKKGISKSTIIYDIKINERRNIPDNQLSYFNSKTFCKIKTCFSFNIVPNKYDIVFFDNLALKNVRTLEYNSFNKYLGDERIKRDELIVVFNKKEIKNPELAESFSFFSIYSKERLGTAQFTLALMLNIFCGLLFFIASFRTPVTDKSPFYKAIFNLPPEIYFAISILLATFLYFLWPSIYLSFKKFQNKS